MSSLQPNRNASSYRQLFDNPILEKLSRTHILIPVGLFWLISAALIYCGITMLELKAWLTSIVYVLGFLVFTLAEYLVHRYLYHMETNTDSKKRLQYIFHGVHHDYPKDKTRLAMPPAASLIISAILMGIFYLFMRNWVFAFLPGFLTGYSLYILMHYVIHAFKPPKNIFRWLWIYHGIHHHKDDTVAFGVSSPLWDFVFGTVPKTK